MLKTKSRRGCTNPVVLQGPPLGCRPTGKSKRATFARVSLLRIVYRGESPRLVSSPSHNVISLTRFDAFTTNRLFRDSSNTHSSTGVYTAKEPESRGRVSKRVEVGASIDTRTIWSVALSWLINAVGKKYD